MIYAPDGSVYTPVSVDPDRAGRIAATDDPYANLRTEYYNADIERMYTPQRTVTTATAPAKRAQQAKEDKQLQGMNVILVCVSGAHDGSEILPVLDRWGIVYLNHSAKAPGMDAPEDVLRSGMEPNPAETPEALIASFGFETVPDGALGKDADGPMAADNTQRTAEVLDWIRTEGNELNGENKPYFLTLRLKGAEWTEGPGTPGTATPTDLEAVGTEPGSTQEIDSCLDSLIGVMNESGLLNYTVVIILNRAEGQAVVIHPDKAGYNTVSEETTDADILATILTLGVTENGAAGPLPEGLKGRDLLSLTAGSGEGEEK